MVWLPLDWWELLKHASIHCLYKKNTPATSLLVYFVTHCWSHFISLQRKHLKVVITWTTSAPRITCKLPGGKLMILRVLLEADSKLFLSIFSEVEKWRWLRYLCTILLHPVQMNAGICQNAAEWAEASAIPLLPRLKSNSEHTREQLQETKWGSNQDDSSSLERWAFTVWRALCA